MSLVIPFVVAVDGPAGSGKSSVSKEVARRLGYGFLDTGAAYRALAWHAEASGVDTDDGGAFDCCQHVQLALQSSRLATDKVFGPDYQPSRKAGRPTSQELIADDSVTPAKSATWASANA